MGVGVSGWQLARAVSTLGGLGVVSSTGLDTVVARRLQLGDVGGHLRRAFAHFPFPGMARRILKEYFIEGGKSPRRPFRTVPAFSTLPPKILIELTVLANFAETFLARENHTGPVGINLLEKIQMPTAPSLFGAMLAGVDYVLMGAGIPRAIPGILDFLANGEAVDLKLDVPNAAPGAEFACHFDPKSFCDFQMPPIARPAFLAIVSSATLATALVRKAAGRIDGFVVEGPTAGGHNAPPRGSVHRTEAGEPIYGERDRADLGKIRALGVPFWLAGSFGRPEKLREALELGATGIQVGTPFAFCEESGIDPEIKRRVLAGAREGTVKVFTDPVASPTGFPFKIVQLEGTSSELHVQTARNRVCDLGYLRHSYQKPDGTLGQRCPGEPLDSYLQRGGDTADTAGRVCVCNGLLATIGLGQIRPYAWEEPALVTAGDDVNGIVDFLPAGAETYCARDVMERLQSLP